MSARAGPGVLDGFRLAWGWTGGRFFYRGLSFRLGGNGFAGSIEGDAAVILSGVEVESASSWRNVISTVERGKAETNVRL